MAEPHAIPEPSSGPADQPHKDPAFHKTTIIPGATAFLLGVMGLAGMYFGIGAFRSFYPGYQTMAFSTAALLVLFGGILVAGAVRPLGSRVRAGIRATVAAIALIEAIELPFSVAGGHFLVEPLLIGVGNAIAGQATSPISPFTLVLVILTSVGIFLLMAQFTPGSTARNRDGAGFSGLVILLAGFTVILSYLYGAPLLYGSGLVPVAAPTALAFCAIGAGLVIAAGPEAAPLRYFSGDSIRTLLLRTFLPLTIMVILAGSIIEFTLRVFGGTFNAILTAAGIVVFCVLMAMVVSRVSGQVGDIIETAQRERRKAEEELRIKNTELEASFEDLTAAEEELRQNYDELAKNQEAIRKSEAQLRLASTYNRSLIEASLDPLVTICPDGTIGDVNEATIKATGFGREALIGTDFSRYFTEPDKAKAGYETVFHEGAVQDYPLEIRHADGKVTPVLYNASVYRDERGLVNGAFAAARDITGQKRAEEAMRTERQRLYDVLETLPVYVCLLNEDYRMPFANRYFRETFGESHGRRCHEFLFGLDKPCESCETYTVMKTRARHHWYWTGPNGRDYDIYDFPFTDSDGSFNILEMGIDITERKRAETALQLAHDRLEERVEQRTRELAQRNEELGTLNEELIFTQEELHRNLEELTVAENGLRESEERYRSRFNALIEGFCVIEMIFDPEGRPADYRFLETNSAFEGQTGLHDAKGKLMRDLAPDHEAHWFEIYGKVAMTGEPVHFENEARALGRWYDVRAFRVGGEGSRNVAICFNDITQRKTAENEIIQKNEDLNALNEELTATQDVLQRNVHELAQREQDLRNALAEKDVLLSEIHHRVKNNLTAFISLLSLEGSMEDTPAGRTLRQDLQNRARSMSLIHETLYRTKLYNEVDMGMYLTTLIDHIGNSFRTPRAVRTIVEAQGVMLDIPRATPAGLIVNELVTNSFKYAFFTQAAVGVSSDDPPTIRITLTKNDGEYVLAVSDNGMGLPAGFDLEKTQTLGLKLVNFLARHQMRATVGVSSVNGTEFVFRFRE